MYVNEFLLYSANFYYIPPHSTKLVKTDVRIAFPSEYIGKIQSMLLPQNVFVIDYVLKNNISIFFINLNKTPVIIKPGECVAVITSI